MKLLSTAVAILFLLNDLCPILSAKNGGKGTSQLTLTILHTNDIHSHIEQSTKYGGVCPDADMKQNKCVGGVARITAKVKALKAEYPGALFMNAGDFYQGTPWYTILKDKIVSAVMGAMQYDYVCLGNHEFDDGPKGLAPFLIAMKDANVTVVNTNANFSDEDALKNISLPKSVTIEINGTKVGIVGAVLHETEVLSNPGNVKFENDLESIQKEARRLDENGTKIIIAITHCGYPRELEIAEKVPEVDIIVGGHTNTFLYHGEGYPPENKPEGDYPTVVNRTGNGSALIVQDFWFGKFLGFLQVTFDAAGNAVSWSGNPILMNASVNEDEHMLNITRMYKQNVTAAMKERIGCSKVLLEQADNICRLRECNLGNLMTDAYFSYYADKNSSSPELWSDVNAAVLNGGTIRAPIERGNITFGDVLQTAPFGQTLLVVTLYGYQLKQMFEHSVGNYSYEKRKGEFLQVSGIHVAYNLSSPPNNRVLSIDILCTNCTVPVYQPYEECIIYKIVTTDFVVRGGDGFQKATNATDSGPVDFEVLKDYIKKMSPIKTPVEGRIKIYGNVTTSNATVTKTR
ncbi:protein 5NUC-like [Dermacentor andersoni]|uniref:protein 5NUC-like n=1 Tax=Dermacentor andersoni TaxID=34620 RepID=UPI0021556771|nr:protein 5NUC-like [Dermacentor andersoni]XP_054933149.1 protein 5NUC-like [Dermacentor andersoni]